MAEVTRLSTESYLNAVAWNKDGSRLAALSGFGGFIRIWDARSWDVLSDFTRYGGAYNGNSFAFLGDGSLLLPAPIGRSPDPPYQELFLSSFEQIDAHSGERIRYVKNAFYDRGRRRIMDTFAASARGQLAAGIPTGNPSLISLFETEGWVLVGNIDLSPDAAPRGFARSLALSGNAARLAVGTANGLLKIFDTENGEPVLEMDFADPSYAISAVAFSPDASMVAVGGSRSHGSAGGGKRTVRFVAVDGARELDGAIDGAIGDVYSLSFAPDGVIAIAGSNSLTVSRVTDTSPPQVLASYVGRDSYSVAFSPQGRLAASKGSTVLIYDVDA